MNFGFLQANHVRLVFSTMAASWCGRARRPLILKETNFIVAATVQGE